MRFGRGLGGQFRLAPHQRQDIPNLHVLRHDTQRQDARSFQLTPASMLIPRTWALLHESVDGRTAPIPGQTCPATFVTGVAKCFLISSYAARRSSVTLNPARPRRQRLRPNRASKADILLEMVDSDWLSSLCATANPPDSAAEEDLQQPNALGFYRHSAPFCRHWPRMTFGTIASTNPVAWPDPGSMVARETLVPVMDDAALGSNFRTASVSARASR